MGAVVHGFHLFLTIFQMEDGNSDALRVKMFSFFDSYVTFRKLPRAGGLAGE